MKFYKIMVVHSSLYGPETCVPVKKDLTRIQASDMKFMQGDRNTE